MNDMYGMIATWRMAYEGVEDAVRQLAKGTGAGVRQLKIHKSSKSGLVAAFMCQVFEFFCCMYVVRRCKLWYNVFGGIPYET